MAVAPAASDDDQPGTAHGRFQRAVHERNVQNAEMAAREMGHVSLADALALCELLAAADPKEYERAALRWLQRFIDERLPPLTEVALAAAALADRTTEKCPMETASVRSSIRATKGPSRQRVPPAPKGRDPRTREGPHSRASAPINTYPQRRRSEPTPRRRAGEASHLLPKTRLWASSDPATRGSQLILR